MKKRKFVIYILIPLLIILTFLFYQYFIKIYEATVNVEPKSLFADNQSLLTITVIPLNGFGQEALFRNSPAEFQITEGSSLVEVILLHEAEGKLILKSKSETGKVVII
ncbi:MAG: hypothetical protein EHM47_13320, partial [Ignavibacteriales bacterium]